MTDPTRRTFLKATLTGVALAAVPLGGWKLLPAPGEAHVIFSHVDGSLLERFIIPMEEALADSHQSLTWTAQRVVQLGSVDVAIRPEEEVLTRQVSGTVYIMHPGESITVEFSGPIVALA